MKTIFPISFLFLFVILSCNTVTVPKIRNNWISYRITNDWLIDAPKDFKFQVFHGIDSEIGSIYSRKDSVNLKYDSWNGIIGEGNYCDLTNQTSRFNEEIKRLKKQYTNDDYEFVIDKINGHLALMVYPKDGKGDYLLEIHNCKVGSHLVVKGINMKNQKMILEIFKTVRYNKVKK